METAKNITQRISRFAADINYEDIPHEVVEESKRLILDSMGCAIGGVDTEKGRIGIRFGEQTSNSSETTILGHGQMVSPVSSAFANGELMNALDYDSLLSPPEHASPYVIPACLAGGEMMDVSGKELITSVAIAHEITTRLSDSLVLEEKFSVRLPEKGISMSLPVPGFGISTFGGIAGGGRLMGLSADEMSNAFGIGGYFSPVPMLAKFAVTVPTTMTKYLSSGMVSQMQLMSLLLTRLGHSADKNVLDEEYGFFKFLGCESWSPERVLKDLGEKWRFPERVFYKTYPCCGAMQNGLSLFERIILSNDLHPDQIRDVTVVMNPLGALPAWQNKDVSSHLDIQFSPPYVFAILAHRVEPGPLWQDKDVLTNGDIRRFCDKVRILTSLDREAMGQPEVSVTALSNEGIKTYSDSGMSQAVMMSDRQLKDKFKINALTVIGEKMADEAVDALLDLERADMISTVMGLLRPMPLAS